MIIKLKQIHKTKLATRVSWFLFGLAFLLAGAHSASAQKASTPAGKSHYASVDGTRIHYQSYGKGSEAFSEQELSLEVES